MLIINGLYKERRNNVIKEVNLSLYKGETVSLECSDEISDMLINMILGYELPGKGEILIEGVSHKEYIKKHRGKIGVISKNDVLYENMTINSYLKLFADIIGAKSDYREIMLKLALLDIGDMKIKNLSYTQKRRVSFARERLKEPALFLFQEPLLNLDRDTAQIIKDNMNELCMMQTAILATSVSFKNTILIGERAYQIDMDGMLELNNNGDLNLNKSNVDMENKIYRIEKIPAKMEDKILLFDPIEIDYIEAVQGVSYLYIKGDKFPCNISLTDLEERLQYFGFFRCHRSYLINLQRVKEVITWSRNSYSLVLGDKAKSSVPLSKGRLEELKQILKL